MKLGVPVQSEDTKLTLRATDCKNSKQCHEPKHHFDECVERVTAAQSEEGGAKEDCIEECRWPQMSPSFCFPALRGWPTAIGSWTPHGGLDRALANMSTAVFHLAHCASQCAAPKLWSVLK